MGAPNLKVQMDLYHCQIVEGDLAMKLGYAGWVGFEYRPQAGLQVGGTSAGLGWLKPYLCL